MILEPKGLLKIFTNPFAVAVASGHWLVVSVAMYGGNYLGEFNQAFLTVILIFINFPALLLTVFFSKLCVIFGEFINAFYLWTFFSIIFVSAQWWLIGYFVAFISGEIKPVKFNLSLIDE
jgi:hypothetical protein